MNTITMRVRVFSLNPIPENYAMSFTSITSDIGMLQELNYRKDTNPWPYVLVLCFIILMGLAIIVSSMDWQPSMILILSAAIIIGGICWLMHIYKLPNLGTHHIGSESIVVVVHDDADEAY